MELPVSDEAIGNEVTGDRGDSGGPVLVVFRHQLLLYRLRASIHSVLPNEFTCEWVAVTKYMTLQRFGHSFVNSFVDISMSYFKL